MRKNNYETKRRCAEELSRIFSNHYECARCCGFGTNQTEAWWNEESVPQAASLYILHQHGVDVLYILTGERNPKLYPGGDT